MKLRKSKADSVREEKMTVWENMWLRVADGWMKAKETCVLHAKSERKGGKDENRMLVESMFEWSQKKKRLNKVKVLRDENYNCWR